VRPLSDELVTPRLRLRRPVVEDAGAIFEAYAQDAGVCRFMIWSPHASQAVTDAFIASCIAAWDVGERLPYVITERESNAAIGMIEARRLGTTVDVGYVLARARWGHGLMPEAVHALSDAALGDPGLFRVQASCDTENIASQRSLEKAGFTREARLERYIVHPNLSPEPRACFLYGRWR
jgi:RimJ/RimL family protein N-acetyltransferase